MSMCIGRRACAVLLVLAFATPALRAAAQAPTRVGVELKILEPTMRLVFGTALTQVEARLAAVIAQQLDRRIGFVRFAPASPEPYRLHFTVDRKDPSASTSLVARGIRVRLIHPTEDTAAYWVTLREAGAFAHVESAESLAREVAGLLDAADYGLIHGLLSHVPIAREALAFDNPPGWALPLGRDSLCIRDQTQLRVWNVERTDLIEQTRPYDAQVLGVVVQDPGPPNEHYLRGLFGETQIPIRAGRVTAVFVTDPRPLPNCRVQPAAPPVGGGGA